MVDALLTAQLPTSAAVWSLGAKLWTPFLRMPSGATGQSKTSKPKHQLPAEGSTNLAMNSLLPMTPEKTPEKPPMASSRLGQILRGSWMSKNAGREPLHSIEVHKYSGRDTEQDQ